MKQNWKPGNMIYPVPAVLVSCGDKPENYNIITIAWVGTTCSSPAMCYISVRHERHSYELIARTREFVINLTNKDLSRATDWCGCRSGRDFNKWAEMGLTPGESAIIKAPTVQESPVNIECKVTQIIPLGSHDMFLAEVVNVQVDDAFIDQESGKFDMEKANLLSYCHGQYYLLGKRIGKFGWSVEKNVEKVKTHNNKHYERS